MFGCFCIFELPLIPTYSWWFRWAFRILSIFPWMKMFQSTVMYIYIYLFIYIYTHTYILHIYTHNFPIRAFPSSGETVTSLAVCTDKSWITTCWKRASQLRRKGTTCMRLIFKSHVCKVNIGKQVVKWFAFTCATWDLTFGCQCYDSVGNFYHNQPSSKTAQR